MQNPDHFWQPGPNLAINQKWSGVGPILACSKRWSAWIAFCPDQFSRDRLPKPTEVSQAYWSSQGLIFPTAIYFHSCRNQMIKTHYLPLTSNNSKSHITPSHYHTITSSHHHIIISLHHLTIPPSYHHASNSKKCSRAQSSSMACHDTRLKSCQP